MNRSVTAVRREIRADLVVAQIIWHDGVRVLFCSWWGHNWRKVYFQGRHSGQGFMLTCPRCMDFRVPYVKAKS